MKSYLSKLIIFFLLTSFLAPLIVNAQQVVCPGTPCPPGKTCIQNPLCANTLWELLDAIINFIFYLAMPIAVIMIIIAGFYFVTAAGDPVKITTAKHIILYTLIGLLIILCATGLIKLFGEIFGVKTPYNP